MKNLDEIEINESDFSEAEKTFLLTLLIDNPSRERSYYFRDYIQFISKKGYSFREETVRQGLAEFESARELAGLETVRTRVLRAVELLWSGRSILPIVDEYHLWQYCPDAGGYFHIANRSYIKRNMSSDIETITEIHNFPSKDYRHWQGYGRFETTFQQPHLLDPFKSPVKYYYTSQWDGEGDLIDHLKTAPNKLPEGLNIDFWLNEKREQQGIPDREDHLRLQ